MNNLTAKRGFIVLGTIIIQMGLGSIYTWSLFNQPLAEKFNLDIKQISITFSITSFALALSTLLAGKLQEKIGIRRLAAISGILLGAGLLLSSQASTLLMLYLFAGVIVGWADGTAYITTLSNLIKWFPNRKGLISGVSVGAYGTGSLLFKYVNAALIDTGGAAYAFRYWGLLVIVMIVIGAMLIKEAPTIEQGGNAAAAAAVGQPIKRDYTVSEMLHTKEAYLLFAILFTACMSGLYLIGIVKDIGMQMAGLDGAKAAGAVSMVAVFNTLGRLILGALSDKVGRMNIICGTMLVTTGAVAYLSFGQLHAAAFYICVSTIAFCFGGNITVFPAIVGDYFGLTHHSKNYGLIYQGFGLGALSGSFIAALFGEFKVTFLVIIVLCILSFAIAVFIEEPRRRKPTGGLKMAPKPKISQ